MGRYSGVEVDWSEVMVTNGAKQAVFQAFAALLDPGDEVLLPSPHWVTYPAGIDLAGGVTVLGADQDRGRVQGRCRESRAGAHRTDTPAGVRVTLEPDGAVYTAEEARAIGEWAKANDIWVLADEIYQRLTYFTDVAPSIAAVTPRFDNWLIDQRGSQVLLDDGLAGGVDGRAGRHASTRPTAINLTPPATSTMSPSMPLSPPSAGLRTQSTRCARRSTAGESSCSRW